MIESLLKQSEFVSQVIVVGAGQTACSFDRARLGESEAGASATGREFSDRVELSKVSAMLVQRDAASLTRELADYERIRRIALLPNEFTIDGGELTPTLKVKRRVIDERFGDLVEELLRVTSNQSRFDSLDQCNEFC